MKQPKKVISKTPSKITQNATPKLLDGNPKAKKASSTITQNATTKALNVGAIRIPNLKI